jgi:hypothetical protein
MDVDGVDDLVVGADEANAHSRILSRRAGYFLEKVAV